MKGWSVVDKVWDSNGSIASMSPNSVLSHSFHNTEILSEKKKEQTTQIKIKIRT